MKSQLRQRLRVSGGIALAVLLLAGCASNKNAQPAETEESYPGGPGDRIEGENPYANQDTPRCPAGYSLQCEAKKVGRIRFSGFGNEDLDKCGCVPHPAVPTHQATPDPQ